MNELRVFISSTFRDLQEEREHLVKKIFPEIRTLCRQRGITFTEVDLRWGLTDQDVALGQVIRTCLEEVDRCRPYFIGITGDRYGFVPTYLDIQKDPVLLEQYPWIEDAAIEGVSITEMEAHYALLAQPPPPNPSPARGGEIGATERGGVESARFYFRRQCETLDDDTSTDDERERLAAYQQRIRACGVSVEQFRDPISLGELIYDDLIEIIKRDFADARPPTPLEQERSRHEAFSLSRRRAYIANPAYLKRLSEHAASDAPPLVVYAESGSGKSSLFAFWADQYRRKHPDAHVVEHYVGIGATATDHYAVIRHICMEINERFGRTEEIPSDPAKLETALGRWLGYADNELQKRDQRMVLILDGLNQLQGTALGLKWIPNAISPSIRLILSSTVEGTLIELQKRGWERFGMQALSEAERETIVVRYLAEYRKSLLAEQIRRIASDHKCGHPLFLKTLLEELRLVGRHEELDAKIESYLEATGTEDLFQRVLERLEEDHNMRAVRDIMVLLSASLSGLDERELSDLSGLARLKIATMVAGLDYHLVRKEGRLTFFHDYLRRAVEKRYLADEGMFRSAHLQIAEYFQQGVTASITGGGTVSKRMARELAYQLHIGGAADRLCDCLSTMEVFLVLYAGETLYEVLSYWSTMGDSTDIEGSYRRGVERWAIEDGGERSVGLGLVANLLQRLGRWGGAIALERERLSMAIARGDSNQEAASRQGLGFLMMLCGEYDEALEELTQARVRSTELGNRRGIAGTIGDMGNVHAIRGEYDRALECYETMLSICEELGDRNGVSQAIGGMGNVYVSRGEYARALECFERKLGICEELGDRSGLSQAIGSMGNVYTNRGEYDRAIECCERQLSICEELGDRSGAAMAIGNMGVVCYPRGEYARALECFERKLSICEELGDRIGAAQTIGNMGNVYSNLGEYDRAIECFEQDLRISEELGDRSGAAVAIGNRGLVYSSRGEYERALESLHHAAEEHRAIGFRDGLTYWLSGTAWVLLELANADDTMPSYVRRYLPDVQEGRWQAMAVEVARACATECIAIGDELAKPDSQFLGSVLVGRIEAAEGNVDAALERLGAMLAEATDDTQMAELHYQCWKLNARGHASEALALYERLYATTPTFDYNKRIEELKAAAEQS